MTPRLFSLLAALVVTVFGLATSPAFGEEITLKGSFTWHGSGGTLKVVLDPVGPNEWKAVYTYQQRGRDGRYTGTLKGDIKNGEVTGTANRNEFTIKGTARDGVITFKHFRRGEPQGEGKLKAEAPKEVTLKGTVVCAKCNLKLDDAKECATVIQVKDGDKQVVYYLDEKAHKDNHDAVCKAAKSASVTGIVTSKGDKKTITVSKIEFDKEEKKP